MITKYLQEKLARIEEKKRRKKLDFTITQKDGCFSMILRVLKEKPKASTA